MVTKPAEAAPGGAADRGPGPPAPGAYRLRERIGHRFSRTGALMHRYFEERLAPLGLTRMAWTVLASIGFEGIDAPSALAEHTGMTRPAVSRILRELERRGLVRRAADGSDGRGRRLALTLQGRRLTERAWIAADETNRRFAGKLAAGELEELYRLLDKLAAGEDGAVREY